MVEGQKGHATSLKQKACLYFKSKHTASVRSPAIATTPELMNRWGKKYPYSLQEPTGMGPRGFLCEDKHVLQTPLAQKSSPPESQQLLEEEIIHPKPGQDSYL